MEHCEERRPEASEAASEAPQDAEPCPSRLPVWLAHSAPRLWEAPVFSLGSWFKSCVQVLPQLTKKQLFSKPLFLYQHNWFMN